jgi:hypothetical protein
MKIFTPFKTGEPVKKSVRYIKDTHVGLKSLDTHVGLYNNVLHCMFIIQI